MSAEFPPLPSRLDRAKRKGGYQVLPVLSPEEYAALKNDIQARGVMVPVEYDEDGNIIDGHHRVRACEELGIKDWPRIVRPYADDAARRTQARKLNIARRHLDTADKRALIEDELRDRPEQTDRAIAKDLGVDHKTVGAVRTKRKANGEIPHKPDRKEASGRKARGRKPKAHVEIPHVEAPAATLVEKPETTPEPTSTERQLGMLKQLWKRSNQDARHGFLQWLGDQPEARRPDQVTQSEEKLTS